MSLRVIKVLASFDFKLSVQYISYISLEATSECFFFFCLYHWDSVVGLRLS